MNWQTKRFDDAQVLIQGPECRGRRELIAVCTGSNRDENAVRIVGAVNSHDTLITACERALELIGDVRPEDDDAADALGQAKNYLTSAIAEARDRGGWEIRFHRLPLFPA